MNLAEVLLSFFVVYLGMALGAGLFEIRIILPQWFPRTPGTGYGVNPEAMQTLETGRKFWAFVTTGPLTLLTLVNLYLAWSSPSPRQDWWLAAGVITLVERLGTFTFFIPTLFKLHQPQRFSPARLHQRVSTWIRLNYLRCALNLLALLAALRALSMDA